MAAFYIMPLTAIPLIIFGVVGLVFHPDWSVPIFSINMISGGQWTFSSGDLLILVGLVCLFFEVLKSTNSTSRAITNHILSTVVFILYLLAFILVSVAANPVFFLLMIMSLFDVIAGFSITIKTASRDIALSRTLDTQ